MTLIRQISVSSRRRTAKAVVSGGLLLGLLTLFSVSPANLPLPSCAFRSITGHDCLTCGMTRSLHAALHGDLAASVRFHLFGPLVLLGLLGCLALFAAEAIRGRGFVLCTSVKFRGRILALFTIFWLVYWGIRLVR